MFSIANLSSSLSTLPAVNIHPHGHKRGAQLESTGSGGSDTAAQVPAATARNLFGSLLTSLEQVVGLQSTPAAATNAAATAGSAAPGTAASAPSDSNAAAPQAAQSASGALRNYLSNLSQNLQADGSQLSTLLGSNLNSKV